MSKEYLNKICGNPNYSDQLIVGPFADIPAANAWAAANPSSLFPGLLATAGGAQIRWGGAGVGWYPVGGTYRVAAPASPQSLTWSIDQTINPEDVINPDAQDINLTFLDSTWQMDMAAAGTATVANGLATFSEVVGNSDARYIRFKGIKSMPVFRSITATINLGSSSNIADLFVLHHGDNLSMKFRISSTGADFIMKGINGTQWNNVKAYAFGTQFTVRGTIVCDDAYLEVLKNGVWVIVGVWGVARNTMFTDGSDFMASYDWSGFMPAIGICTLVTASTITFSDISVSSQQPVGYRDFQFVRDSSGNPVQHADGRYYATATTSAPAEVTRFEDSRACLVLVSFGARTEIELISYIYIGSDLLGTGERFYGSAPVFLMRGDDGWYWFASTFALPSAQISSCGIMQGKTLQNVLSGGELYLSAAGQAPWLVAPEEVQSQLSYDAHVIYYGGKWRLIFVNGYSTDIVYSEASTLAGLKTATRQITTGANVEGPKFVVTSSGLYVVGGRANGDMAVYSVSSGLTYIGVVGVSTGLHFPHYDLVAIPSAHGSRYYSVTFDYTEYSYLGAYSHGRPQIIVSSEF